MRITQHTGFLTSLTPSLAKGHLLPAGMQRPYVWGRDDVLALFDSIMNEFPIGSFVAWQVKGDADLTTLAKSRLGPVEAGISTSVMAPNQLLLEGQNRLATIAWAMFRGELDHSLDYSEAERAVWMGDEVLVLDGETRSVIFVPKAEADKGLRLPIWCINNGPENHSDAMTLVRKKYIDEWKDLDEGVKDDFLRFFDAAQEAYRNARIVMTIIENATPDEARHAFLRVCRVGVAMSQEDFDRALQWAV